MSAQLHSSAAQKSRDASRASTKRKGYDKVQQGIKELYPLDHDNLQPDLDIVFVPGLGANPEESWKSGKTGFNWTTDKDGLQRDFPQARFLLYMYESAWTGELKVKQFMNNIAMGLLISLRSKRENCRQRPIVFIGHSMGGLAIAKAITLADSRRDLFPETFEATTACIFFGTPFAGAPVASAAAMLACCAELADKATTSKLLDLMKPENEELRQLRDDFARLAAKVHPSIKLYCFWEEQDTDFAKMAGLPSLFGLTKSLVPQRLASFVDRNSATLTGVDNVGLACNHRDLVKFEGPKDMRWLQMVRDPIKEIINKAQHVVKKRLNTVRNIDRSMISGIMSTLEGAQPIRKKRILSRSFPSSTWLPHESEYSQWLTASSDQDKEQTRAADFIYVRGREGRGKTSAVMAALEGVEKVIQENPSKTGQDSILMAYFFCDPTDDYCTAEDILKSVICQLINQQEILAPYAKTYVDSVKSTGPSAPRARITIENLWQTLQDMLTDDLIGKRVYFVLNNLHILAAELSSTQKLMDFIKEEVLHANENGARSVSTRWFITSRATHAVDNALIGHGVRLIDLEDAKYEDQVQRELRRHAKTMISTLSEQKQYNQALTYFASSLIGKRAQNTQWVDITCSQLRELDSSESDLRVRKLLEATPQDLKNLLDHDWNRILRTGQELDIEKLKEVLRALVLTFEDPMESELAVLAGLTTNERDRNELRSLVSRCKPLLETKRASKTESYVCFMNTVVKNHLRDNAGELLGLFAEEKKWQHGVLALRCLSHLKADLTDQDPEQPNDVTQNHPIENVSCDENDYNNGVPAAVGTLGPGEGEDEGTHGAHDMGEYPDIDEDGSEDGYEYSDEDWTEEEVGSYPDQQQTTMLDSSSKSKVLPYIVKNWLDHASKATLDIAEDLSLDDFWDPASNLRSLWLREYTQITSTFKEFGPNNWQTLTGLHVAASVGFRQLVAALIQNGHNDEIHKRDSLHNSPLHLAAYLGRLDVVEELLDNGADVNDAAQIQASTPLQMAAYGGHIDVMAKLLSKGAEPNASSEAIGPVINSAILSGNRASVELLVKHEASISSNAEDLETPCPLALAALLADYSMFEYLIGSHGNNLTADDYGQALVYAAAGGKLEALTKLLDFEPREDKLQDSLDVAATRRNWDIATVLLDRRGDLNVNTLFLEAAVCKEVQTQMVEKAWIYANGSIDEETLNNALYQATDNEKTSTVELLLDICKASPNATGDEYGNALTAAAFDGIKHMVELLLSHGANVNDPSGWALQTAAAQGHKDIVEVLLSSGADINVCTESTRFLPGTALQAACEAGDTVIVHLLLEAKADPNKGTGIHSPPIVAASKRGEGEILRMLVDAGAELDVLGGPDLSTPLINAAAYLPKEFLEILLQAGANINLPDDDGDTALIVAAVRGDPDALEFLLDNGADWLHYNHGGYNAMQSILAVDTKRITDVMYTGDGMGPFISSPAGQQKCLSILIQRSAALLHSLKRAFDSGNEAVISIIGEVNTPK